MQKIRQIRHLSEGLKQSRNGGRTRQTDWGQSLTSKIFFETESGLRVQNPAEDSCGNQVKKFTEREKEGPFGQ